MIVAVIIINRVARRREPREPGLYYRIEKIAVDKIASIFVVVVPPTFCVYPSLCIPSFFLGCLFLF